MVIAVFFYSCPMKRSLSFVSLVHKLPLLQPEPAGAELALSPRRHARQLPWLPDALQLTLELASSPALAYPAEDFREWTAVQGWGEIQQGLQALTSHRDSLQAAITQAEANATPIPAQAAAVADLRAQLGIAYAKMEALCWAIGLIK